METIPSPVYIGILAIMWTFASIRGGPFPLRIVTLYSAFFIIGASTNYLVEQEIIPLQVLVIAQCLLICTLYDVAKKGRSIKAVGRICYVLFGFMGLIFYSYALDLNYETLHYQTQNTLLNVHNLFSVILEIYMIWLLVEVIDGTRGDPIYTKLLAILFYGLSVFAPHREAFNYQEEGNR